MRSVLGGASKLTLQAVVVAAVVLTVNRLDSPVTGPQDAASPALPAVTSGQEDWARIEKRLMKQSARVGAALAALNDRLALIEQRGGEERGAAPVAEASAAESPSQAWPDDPAWAAQARERALADGLAAEAVDQEWADAAASTVLTAFDSEGFAALDVVNLECRTTLCRVELEADDLETMLLVQRRLPGAVASRLPRLTMSLEALGGRYVSVAYLAREGFRLPAAEARH